ncbi:MAG: MATE family efflux transporter [Actinomycetales bacterium]
MDQTNAPAPLTRQILALAVPAFGALVAEPLFLLADSAIVGHLGVDQLAGVGLASTALQTAVGLLVFLAYSTTPAVARLVGAGRHGQALAAGRDGLYLAALLGVLLAAAGMLAAGPLVHLLGGRGAVLAFGTTYLLYALPGVPAMLLIFAAAGVLRGLQDTRTPLLVAGAGFTANIALNWFLVYGLGLSVAGSALGTSVAQWAMAAVYLVLIGRQARRLGVGLLPHWAGIGGLGKVGGWLFLRTLSLRAGILATVLVASGQGPVNLAAHQLAMTVFTFLAFALDALAIAAQALVGKELGAGNVRRVEALTRRLLWFGVGGGAAAGVLLLAGSPWIGWIFSTDPRVHAALTGALVVLAIAAPLAGFVFVLDGVLIGAGDSRYLALAGVVNLLGYLPLLGWVLAGADDGAAGLAQLWAAFALGYLGLRAATLGFRARGTAWIRTGAAG